MIRFDDNDDELLGPEYIKARDEFKTRMKDTCNMIGLEMDGHTARLFVDAFRFGWARCALSMNAQVKARTDKGVH